MRVKKPEGTQPDAERDRIIAAINRVVEREGSQLDPFWVMAQAMVYAKDKSWSETEMVDE